MKQIVRFLSVVICFFSISTHAFAQSSSAAPALKEVIAQLSAELGIESKELTAETDLLADVGIDRTKLHYILQEMYLALQVEAPEDELSKIGDIAEFIDLQRDLDLTLRADDVENISYYSQRVHFATTRRQTNNSDIRKAFDGARVQDQKLRYGFADVNIPLSHKKGQIETPWRNIQRLQDKRKHIFLMDVKVQGKEAYFADIKERFTDSKSDILIYVHGYNVTFEDAMLRAAQVAVDFNFQGPPVAFTWPSNGKTISYASDWADALWSAAYFENYLKELKARFGDRRIHIISHSMGNKVLLHAMKQMAARGDDLQLENVILCAPDFDAQFFVEQIANPIRSLAKHWTIYTSENDLALNISRKVSDAPRLGSPTPYAEGYEIIDASKIEVSPWSVPENHSYYAVKSKVIDDIAAVLAGTRPDKRKLKARTTGDETVWAF